MIHTISEIRRQLSIVDQAYGPFNRELQEFARHNIFGFEIDQDLHLLAKINLIIHGDGFGSIYNEDFLSRGTDEIADQRFDIVLTNPPFSFPVRNKEVLAEYELARGRNSEEIDILYVEKCIKLLKEDGVLSIVLPEGLMNLPSYRYFREFVLSKSEIIANISIPAGSFIPFGGSSAKTCILFLKKKGKIRLDRAFVADAGEIGFEIGKKDYARHNRNDLIDFAAHFHSQDKQIRTTEWGGRSAFLPHHGLDPVRLDSKYQFAQMYLNQVRNSGRKVKKLSEVATVSQPRVIPSKRPEREYYYLEVPDISEEAGTIGNFRRLKGKYINGAKTKFEAGDILFTRLYPDKNRVAIIPSEIKEGVCSAEMYVVRPIDPDQMNPYVLLATLRSSMVVNQVKDLIAGSSSSRPRIDERSLKDLIIPILNPMENEKIALEMKDIVENYWKSAQKYLAGYKNVMKCFGDDIRTNLMRKA